MNKKETPIQIYLDSSDYSQLSDPHKLKSNQKLFELNRALNSYVEKGIIVIRYSCIHILEMAHIRMTDRQLSLKRFNLMKQLCKTHTLKPIPEIEDIEFRKLACNALFLSNKECAAEDNGRWFPDFADKVDNFRQIAINSIRDTLNNMSLPRKQRKAIEKKMHKNGKFTDTAFQYLSQNRNDLLEKLSNEFPLTNRFWKDDLILQFFGGKISNRELLNEIQLGFFDAENFIGWYIDRYKKGKSIPSWLRDAGNDNLKKIQYLREEYEKLMDFGIKTGKSEKEIYADIKKIEKRLKPSIKLHREKILTNIWKKRRHKLLKHGLTEKIWKEKIVNSNLGEIPSIDIYAQALFKYIINNVSNLRFQRKILGSDHADLLHIRYLPYVDIFRADGYMGNLIKPLAKSYNTQIVTSLGDIPDAINNYLKSNL